MKVARPRTGKARVVASVPVTRKQLPTFEPVTTYAEHGRKPRARKTGPGPKGQL